MPKAADIKAKPVRLQVMLPRDLYIKLRIMAVKESNGAVSRVVERLAREATDNG